LMRFKSKLCFIKKNEKNIVIITKGYINQTSL
jgi:hypothetical protein